MERGKGREKGNYFIIFKKDIQIYRSEHSEIKTYTSLAYFTIPKQIVITSHCEEDDGVSIVPLERCRKGGLG